MTQGHRRNYTTLTDVTEIGMLVVETVVRIRREHANGKAIKAIARDLRLSRKVVRKAIRAPEGAFDYHRTVQPLPRLEGGAHAAVRVAGGLCPGLSPRDPGDGVRCPCPGLCLLRRRSAAGDLR